MTTKLPETVKIMGIVYDVKEVLHLLDSAGTGKLDGNVSYSQTLISIEETISLQNKKITAWHEVIHAMLDYGGFEQDERLVSFLSTAICGFIQDNPEMVE